MSKLTNAGVYARRIISEPGEFFMDMLRGVRAGNDVFLEAEKQKRNVHDNSQHPPALFLWIPKSAGTSVFAAFEKCGGQKLLSTEEIQKYFKHRGVVAFSHIHVLKLVELGLVSKDFVAKAFKFTIVRNPFDRAVSLFEYLKSDGQRFLPKTTNFEIFCSFLELGAFEEVGLINHDGLSQLNPQATWLVDKSNKLIADQVYRFENLSEQWPEIWRKVGLKEPAPNLPALNRSERRPAGDYYSERTIRIVRKVYEQDFSLFGYSPEPHW